ACLPLPLSRRGAPSQLPAIRTCGSYRLTACVITTRSRAAGPGTPNPAAVERHPLPVLKAKAEYAAFMRQPGAEAAARALPVDADQEDLLATVTREPPAAPPPAAVASTPPIMGHAARDQQARPALLPAATPN